jgi:hypothetical protein
MIGELNLNARVSWSDALTKLDEAENHLKAALYPTGDETQPRDLPDGVASHLASALGHIEEARTNVSGIFRDAAE